MLKISLSNRILIALAIVTLVACGGGGDTPSFPAGPQKQITLQLVNNSGNSVRFLYPNGYQTATEGVGAGQAHNVSAVVPFPKGATNNTKGTLSVVADPLGGTRSQDTVELQLGQNVQRVTATYQGAGLTLVSH